MWRYHTGAKRASTISGANEFNGREARHPRVLARSLPHPVAAHAAAHARAGDFKTRGRQTEFILTKLKQKIGKKEDFTKTQGRGVCR